MVSAHVSAAEDGLLSGHASDSDNNIQIITMPVIHKMLFYFKLMIDFIIVLQGVKPINSIHYLFVLTDTYRV